MKKYFLALMLLSSAAANAQTSDAKQQVIDATEQWIAAENTHDAAALDRILDDQFISTYAANPPRSKTDFIRGITKGKVDPTQTQDLSDVSVAADGDTAVIVGTDTFHSATQAPVAPLRFTITYVRKQGRWVALGEHIVAIPAGP
ncbi:MAG TPA: nuclear transport factor 2 family protein [Rhizomicrobium sp.]|nr:nuclear transport factor 2 family protein [Rhizomicrobium sp.]